jgi:hypothetical protein
VIQVGPDRYIDIIDPGGTLIDTVRLELPYVTSSDQTSFDIVWTGSTLSIAWAVSERLWTSINALDGSLISSHEITTTSRGSCCDILPDIAWTGSELGVFWLDERTGNSDIYFTQTSAAGTPRISDVRMTRTPEEDAENTMPSATWTGSSYGMAWRDWDGLDINVYFTHFWVCP